MGLGLLGAVIKADRCNGVTGNTRAGVYSQTAPSRPI